MSDSLQLGPTRHLCHGDSSGRNTGVDWNTGIHGILAMPPSKGSSQARDRTQVSHVAGGFFTDWASEAQEYWRGSPIHSPGDLSDPGIEPGSPTLQAYSLPAELQGKPISI